MGTEILEQRRLAVPDAAEAARRYLILDTPPEETFDRLARVAARACAASSAALLIFDGERAWPKAVHGVLPEPILPPAFRRLLEETRTPLGAGERAAAPLVTPDGHLLGALLVAEPAPRAWEAEVFDVLRGLADLAMDRLEARRIIDLLSRQKESMERLTAAEAREEGWGRTELLESVIEQITDGVLVVDATGDRLIRNSAGVRLVGMSSPDANPREWATRFGFYLPDQVTPLPPEDNPLARVLRGEEPRDVLLFLRNPANPAGRWVSMNAVPLRGTDGACRGGIITMRDVTERREAERLLREDEERFRALARSAFEGLVISADGKMIEVNEAFCRMTGYAPGELIGRGFDELVSPAYVPLVRGHAQSGSEEAYEAELRRKDGETFPAELRGRSVDYRGRRVRVKAVVDVGPRREAERATREGLRRALAQQNALLDLTRGPDARELDAALGGILRTCARTLGVERASLWLLSPDRARICCRLLYEAKPDRMSVEADLKRNDCPAYFQALESSDLVATEDARVDPRTSAFADAYLRPRGISSMLDAPVSEEGALSGVLCLEHVGPPRAWTQDERTFALAAAGLVSRALGDARRRESEARLRDFLENAHDFVIILDPNGTYTYVNRAWRDTLGYSLEEALTLSWEDVVVPEQVAAVRVRWAKLLEGEDIGVIDVTCRAKDGRRIQARGRVNCLRVDGRPVSVRGIFRDVTEQETVAEALRASQAQVVRLEEKAGARTSLERLIGKSAVMRDVFERLRLAAQSDVTVLLTGESGTGKELAAAAIHALGARRGKRFLAVNCSAIPDALLESELFGHVKGAFTGAVRDKVGLFQAAEGGTLFLDEVGDMSPALQVKVLRALQEREVRRVGDERAVKVDVRLIAATNRDLPALIAEQKIREDFYYRIRVFQIPLPPLRERRDDIPLLLDAFVKEFSRVLNKPVREVAPDALRALVNHPWPGNVRELRNAVEHAFVTLRDGRLCLDDLPPELRAPAPPPPRPAAPSDDGDEKARILDALRRAGGRRQDAARLLGVSRGTLWNRMKRYGIDS